MPLWGQTLLGESQERAQFVPPPIKKPHNLTLDIL